MYDGLQEHLEKQNRKRKEQLDFHKTEQQKKRRIDLKKKRTIDAQCRKEWSKKHEETLMVMSMKILQQTPI